MSFDDDLTWSESCNAAISTLLGDVFLGAMAVTRAGKTADRNGTDWWIEHTRGEPISVDVKARRLDPREKYGDDYAIETVSMVETGRIGWSLDETKRTDCILWFFSTTGRWALFPFLPLLIASRRYVDVWRKEYGERTNRPTDSGRSTWRSRWIPVPGVILWRAIHAVSNGKVDPVRAPNAPPQLGMDW